MPITTYPITGKTTIANTLTLNIGLNNNGRNVAQLLQYFRTKNIFIQFSDNIHTGEWNGQKEETLVVKGITNMSMYEIKQIVNYLNNICTQICIAYKYNDNGVLQYNETYQGKKLNFDNNYFLNN